MRARAQFIQASGIIVGVAYYILNIQNNQRNQQLQLETRQSQFMSQISNEINSIENWEIVGELLSMEWKDWEDFEKKYGSTGNPEAASRRFSYSVNWRTLVGYSRMDY